MRSTLVAFVLVVGTPLAARAQPEAAASGERAPSNVSIGANLGFGSPTGSLGVSFTHHGLAPLELELGIGASDDGPKVSFVPKLLVGRGPLRPLVGVGPAVSVAPVGRPAFWINWEAGLEYRKPSGGFVALALGQRILAAGTVERGCWVFCDLDQRPETHGPGWRAGSIRLTLGTRL
jgi:hypothetical protein